MAARKLHTSQYPEGQALHFAVFLQEVSEGKDNLGRELIGILVSDLQGIEMCPSTAAAMFGEALTRLYGIESILTPADSSGAGSCAVLAEDLEGLEAQINKAETDAQDMRSVGTEKGAVKASRAKRLHESGVNTAQVCAVAEGLLDVCNAHATMQVRILFIDFSCTLIPAVRVPHSFVSQTWVFGLDFLSRNLASFDSFLV